MQAKQSETSKYRLLRGHFGTPACPHARDFLRCWDSPRPPVGWPVVCSRMRLSTKLSRQCTLKERTCTCGRLRRTRLFHIQALLGHLLSRTRVCPTVCFQRLMLCPLNFLEWTINVAGCSWQLPLLALATALFPPNFSLRYGASRGSLKRRALCSRGPSPA